MRRQRERCDRCSKWVEMGQLFTLPENLHHLLRAENEFSICSFCCEKYTEDQWVKWIINAREKGLSFKNWNGN